MSTNLEQTKGKIKITGIVKGIGNENAYREGFTKTSEKAYKSLAFFVETSAVNRIRVELFGMERDHVYAYSQKAKKSKKIPWTDRGKNHNDFKVLGVNMFLEKEEGAEKNTRKVLVEYDAIDYIKEHLKDGDVVRINGELDAQVYENSQGEEVESKRYIIRSITKLYEELDFEAEDFKEVASFEQEIVVTDTMVDVETKKLLIGAKVIKYGGEHVDITFTVDGEKYPKLANNMKKRLSYGDFIKVYGNIINSVIKKELDETDGFSDEDDWGGDEEIKKDFDNQYINDYIQELQIISVDSSTYEKRKYKEEDFINEDEDKFDGDVDGDDFSDDDDDDEINVDDLPFV